MIFGMKNNIKNIITTIVIFLFSKGSAYAQGCSWSDCPASVMSDITAAFATEGYWLLADVVYQIGSTNLGLWAPLIYIMAYAAAGIMLAMGQPPKNWLWLILGPVIYNWLVFTTPDNPVKGVGWRIINEPADQKIVWRKSEVGLLNTNQIANPSKDSEPGNSVEVPLLFLWVDELVSSTVQHLAAWSGVFRKLQGTGSTYTHVAPTSGGGSGVGQQGDENLAWLILSHSKWPMLESITQAKLINHNTREAFIAFLSSECGDEFFENINKAKYINAANAPGRHLPDSIFGEGRHSEIIESLATIDTPVPSAVRELLKDEGVASDGSDTFTKFLGNVISQDQVDNFKVVECNKLFGLIAQAFRWEAGHVYNQIIRQAGGEYQIPEDQINYDFLYGWAVAQGDDPESPENLSVEDQKHFVINLILMHLIRNEFAFAPGQINKRWTQAEHDQNYAESYQKTIGSKTKYGEMYTWTKLMPYIQGVLLYFLSAAYPFACMLMVVPGWHKTLFTWIGFFAWAKSWDIGFAMIGQLEKSIWAMLSNSDNDAIVNGRIDDIKEISKLEVECTGGSAGNGGLADGLGCADPIVTSIQGDELDKLLELFDRGLLLSNNLDMDIHNSYYIYLMSALYFGVPVATGQLFLGARASSASMVNNMASPAQQDGGRGTQTGFQSDNAAKLNANMATGSQAAYAKSMRQQGFALRSLGASNQAVASDTESSKLQAAGSLLQLRGQSLQAQQADEAGYHGAIASIIGANWQNYGRVRQERMAGNGGAAPGGQGGDPLLQNNGMANNGTMPATGNAGNNAPAATGNFNNMLGKVGNFMRNGGKGLATDAKGLLAPSSALNVLGTGANQFSILGSQRKLRRAEAGLRLQQAGLTNSGFDLSAQSKGQQQVGQRYDALANHQAQEDQWNFMQDWTGGNFAGSASIATGLSPGAISAPQQRSTNMMGMAGTGFLGNDAQKSFVYFDQGTKNGYLSGVQSARTQLESLSTPAFIGNRETGYDSIDSAVKGWSSNIGVGLSRSDTNLPNGDNGKPVSNPVNSFASDNTSVSGNLTNAIKSSNKSVEPLPGNGVKLSNEE